MSHPEPLKDFYELLGLPPLANADEIRQRYRFLVQAFHPDKFNRNSEYHALAEHQVKQLNEAYRILSDPDRRARYDAARPAPFKPAAGGPWLDPQANVYMRLQRELEQAYAKIFNLERELNHTCTKVELLTDERKVLQQRLSDLETAHFEDRQTLDGEKRAVTSQIDQLVRERTQSEQALKEQVEQANRKAQQWAQEVENRDRLVGQLKQIQDEWKRSSQTRFDTVAQQTQRLREDVAAKEAMLARQMAEQQALEERRTREAQQAEQLIGQLTATVQFQQAELAQLHAQVASYAAAEQHGIRVQRLWQIAVVVGVVNVVILLALFLSYAR